MEKSTNDAGPAGLLHGSGPVTEWRPARLISDQHESRGYALLVLNQPLENLDLLKLVWEKAGYRIAADGGGNRLHDVFDKHPSFASLMKKIPLEVIHGDLDSLKALSRLWALSHSTAIDMDPSQDSTDFTKCISYIATHYAPTLRAVPDILVLGGLGGRVDQGLSILHHLYKAPELYPQGRIFLLSSSAITFLLTAGCHRIVVKDAGLGRHVGIMPLGAPARISTRGLEWDVQDWETRFGGQMSTSNLVREEVVVVETSADVLFTIDLEIGDEED